MLFDRPRVVASTVLACTVGLPLQVLAEASPPRVEVTGSSIRRAAGAGPLPVEILGRAAIERSGVTTLAELVRLMPALDVLDHGETSAASPTGSGTATVQMRGLGERNVLVLLNGRRLPINALTDGSGAGAAVDINLIPLGAVERIELLKDGGSAIYGADAVAGVMNIVTRRDVTGLALRAGLGGTTHGDAHERTAGLSAGFTGPGGQGLAGAHLLATLELFERDPLPRARREISRSSDWRGRYDGGVDGRSLYAPAGNILDADAVEVIGTRAPCAPADRDGAGCRFDVNRTVLAAINGARRHGGLLIGSLPLAPDLHLQAEWLHAGARDQLLTQPAPDAVEIDGAVTLVRPLQAGPRTTERRATLSRWVTALDGRSGDLDWDLAFGQGDSRVLNRDRNYLDARQVAEAIADASFDPTSSTNPVSVMDRLQVRPLRHGRSTLRFAQTRFGGPAVRLPGGAAAFAVGLSWQQEQLRDTPDPLAQQGLVFGDIQQAPVQAGRRSRAWFGELSLPLSRTLELQLALRHDRHDQVQGWVEGGRVRSADARRGSRKVAGRWQPRADLALRASWAQSFLAPTLKQLFGATEEGMESTDDTALLCPAFGVPDAACSGFPYRTVAGAQPGLRPEIGHTVNLGLVADPSPGWSVGIDLWRIRKRDEVEAPDVATAVREGAYALHNHEWTVYTHLRNLARRESIGSDVDLRWRLDRTPLGRLVIGDTLTWYHALRRQDTAGAPVQEQVGTFLRPRWRNIWSVTAEQAGWSGGLALRSTGPMRDTDQPVGSAAHAAARTIASHHEIDLTCQWRAGARWRIDAAVKNLFDRAPPYAQMATSNQYGGLGFPYLHSPRGRFVQLVARQEH
ncbi:MAG: hypothetical protein RL223_3754 [Pseudomonadota bacterium]